MLLRIRKIATKAVITTLVFALVAGLFWWTEYHAKKQDEIDHALMAAVYRNDVHEVRRLLALGSNPNQPDTYPKTSSVTRFLSRLLQRNGEARNGVLPLFAAFSNPHMDDGTYSNVEIVKALLEYGGDPNVRNSLNETPLILACKNGNSRSICALVDNGANVNVRDNYEMTPLLLAANIREPQAINSLIEHGADVNAVDLSGETALMGAVFYYNEIFVECILRAHCDVNRRSSSGDTAIKMARRIGSKKIILMLVVAGAR